MNKITVLLAPILFSCFSLAAVHAENEVKMDMKVMGKNFSAANKAEDLASLKKDIFSLREAAVQAQKEIPDHLKVQVADSADRKLYIEGISRLLFQIDATLALADTGNFNEAKADLAKLKAIQGEYHKKLKP